MPAETSQNRERALPGQIQRQQERIRARLTLPQEPDPSTPTPPSGEAPVEPPAPQVQKPTHPTADPRKSDPAYWEQRFKVTQGILNQTREEHAEEVDALRARVAELQRQLSEKTSTTAEIDLGHYFTPEQVEQLGEDQCKAMAATAAKAARTQAQALIDAEIAPLKTAREDDAKRAKSAKLNAFKERLAELVPDYAEIDKDPGWLEHLAEVDPENGLLRQDILDMHIGRLSARGVAQMFEAFKATKAVPTPPTPPSGDARPGGPPPPPAPSKGYPSKEEIKQHYRLRALRQVSDVEHAAFEARLQSRAPA